MEKRATPEYEKKRPFYRSPAFWLIALSILLNVINQVAAILPADNGFLPMLTAAATIGGLVEQGLVRQSRNTSAAQVQVAKINAANAPNVETKIVTAAVQELAKGTNPQKSSQAAYRAAHILRDLGKPQL